MQKPCWVLKKMLHAKVQSEAKAVLSPWSFEQQRFILPGEERQEGIRLILKCANPLILIHPGPVIGSPTVH